MLKVNKFKLLSNGVKGISATGIEHKIKDNSEVLADVTVSLKIPLPGELTSMVQRLKKYFLEIMNYWDPKMDLFLEKGVMVDYNEGFDKDLYNRALFLMGRIKVSGVVRKDASYCLTGSLATTNGQVMGLSTPMISFKDGYLSFDKLQFGCEKCLTEVAGYIMDKKLKMMQPRQFMLQLFDEDKDKIEEIKNMSDEEVKQLQIKELEKQGVFVMTGDDFVEQVNNNKKDINNFLDEKPVEESDKKQNGESPAFLIPETRGNELSHVK